MADCSRRACLCALAATALPALPGLAQQPVVKAVTVAQGLHHPWSLAFLPDGGMLVTERAGRMRIVSPGGDVSAPLAGLPAVEARSQGGLLDVALDPKFADNQLVYWSYAELDADGNGTAVARGRLNGQRLDDVRVIFRQKPKVPGNAHLGSRLVFDRNGRLFVTMGDRMFQRHQVQQMNTHIGKIVRIESDGRVPSDNPFAKTQGALPEIWSIGHRNVQGATLHPTTGALWVHEHGPEGGDEVNIAQAGRNYGWPLTSHGVDYGTGAKIGEGATKDGIEAPLTVWVPSIAPSGMVFLTSDRYADLPGWKGSLFVGALRAQTLVRLEFDGRKVLKEERLLLGELGRIRDVRQGPDGYLYLLTDVADGRIVRVERAVAP